jgi:nucleotide-binding universal stress UspA family protein
MREIGVGYDGSSESAHALQFARTLAQELGAKLSAFEAITLPSTALSTGPLPFDEMVSTLVAEARDRIAAHRATNDRICISTATLRSSGGHFALHADVPPFQWTSSISTPGCGPDAGGGH